jgi:hypothetical protein
MSMMMRRLAAVLAAALVVAALFPGAAMAAEKRIKVSRPDGRAPAKWDLPKPKALPHPDVAPPTAGGNGDGYNNISFGAFDNGDIVVVLGTSTGHAGVFDRAYYSSLNSYAVLSANVTPKNGVQRELCSKYRTYPEAYGLWVPGVDWLGTSVRDYCRRQLGEPYNIASSKADETQWYCSKLAWAGWYRIAARDIDADGGYWVWPADLVNSRWTAVLGHWV